MNAAERANTIALTSRIAGTVNLFKALFPDVRSDLKPWQNDPDTRDLVDPESIDIGFHFPGYSRPSACRSILVQIRFFEDPLEQTYRAIGLELAGYDHRGRQWHFSTIDAWEFGGQNLPRPEAAEKLKQFCRQVFALFNDGQDGLN